MNRQQRRKLSKQERETVVKTLKQQDRELQSQKDKLNDEALSIGKEIASKLVTTELIPLMKASMQDATKLSSKSIDNVISKFLDKFGERTSSLTDLLDKVVVNK